MKEIRKMNQEIMKIEKATENGLEVLDRMKSSIDGQNNIILMDAVSNMTKTLKSASLVSMGTELPARVQFFPYSGKLNAHNLIGNLNFVNPNEFLGEVFNVKYLPEAEDKINMAQCPVRSCEICENSPGSKYCVDCEQFFYSAASKARLFLDKYVLAAENSIRRAKEKIISSKMNPKNHEDEADKAKKDIVERMAVIIHVLYDTQDAYFNSIDKQKIKESRKLKQEILKIEKATENDQEVLNKMKNSIIDKIDVILLDSLSDITKTLKLISRVSAETTIPSSIQFHPVSTKPESGKLIGNINFVKLNTTVKEHDTVKTSIKVGDRVRVKPSVKKSASWVGLCLTS
ncbi:unnamed protein product [Mytilus coruscus]|uniref:Uncharacterized protein n=1 Tax=Mytilus coruscus TaxID=42192 RepID=A0A6J8AVU5_MYTCO|nr:unnamed protein product [Mytilus coruscus]